VDPKNLFLLVNHSLEVYQSFNTKKYHGNAINVIFHPLKTEIFCMKKHYFWNFSSPASEDFFLKISNIPAMGNLRPFKLFSVAL
jgi:hypothetical protein